MILLCVHEKVVFQSSKLLVTAGFVTLFHKAVGSILGALQRYVSGQGGEGSKELAGVQREGRGSQSSQNQTSLLSSQ